MRIPDMVRAGAPLLGAEGEAWLAGLPDLAAQLAAEWDLELGEVMTGGTAAVVLAARTAAGREVVLKLPPPPRRSDPERGSHTDRRPRARLRRAAGARPGERRDAAGAARAAAVRARPAA
jgi:hypothetical protein